jgi:hypothetical protein
MTFLLCFCTIFSNLIQELLVYTKKMFLIYVKNTLLGMRVRVSSLFFGIEMLFTQNEIIYWVYLCDFAKHKLIECYSSNGSNLI